VLAAWLKPPSIGRNRREAGRHRREQEDDIVPALCATLTRTQHTRDDDGCRVVATLVPLGDAPVVPLGDAPMVPLGDAPMVLCAVYFSARNGACTLRYRNGQAAREPPGAGAWARRAGLPAWMDRSWRRGCASGRINARTSDLPLPWPHEYPRATARHHPSARQRSLCLRPQHSSRPLRSL